MQLDEEKLNEVLHSLSMYVHNRDIVECKRFIGDFIEWVIVYETKVEVVLKISSAIVSGCEYSVTKSVNRQFLPSVK